MVRHGRTRRGQTCRDEQVAKENSNSTDIPRGMRLLGNYWERNCQLMQIFRIKWNVTEHIVEKCEQRRKDLTDLHMYRHLTTPLEVCMESGGVVGRLSTFQTFSKTPLLSTELSKVVVIPLGRGC